ncbi:MAG: hypothetical protein ACRDJH_23950 [Thermomicrobiales bacterium]
MIRRRRLRRGKQALGTLDAFDWYGTWKLFDGLAACAFEAVGCDESLGGTPFQQWMGEWSMERRHAGDASRDIGRSRRLVGVRDLTLSAADG